MCTHHALQAAVTLSQTDPLSCCAVILLTGGSIQLAAFSLFHQPFVAHLRDMALLKEHSANGQQRQVHLYSIVSLQWSVCCEYCMQAAVNSHYQEPSQKI